LLNDLTADIYKENDIWNILITIFFEVTQNNNEELIEIGCHITSTLHISQSENISSTREILLNPNRKYVNVNILLTVPVVRTFI
jgi:hypothetical protein